VRAFGVNTWAIVLPQVVEGVLAVLVLYRIVRRLGGPGAGVVGGGGWSSRACGWAWRSRPRCSKPGSCCPRSP
jgi:4-amino-4-deoxy-L-arabinose transferase-like glycosyltransferase